MKKTGLTNFQEFRLKKIQQLEEKRLTPSDLSNSIFGFVVKHHLKPGAKAQNSEQVLMNYYYWMTFIERKVIMEENLISLGLGTEEQLIQSVRIYVKRRDKMVSRLIAELGVKPLRVVQIGKDCFEFIFAEGFVLHGSSDVVIEAGIAVTQEGTSLFPLYSARFILPY